MVLETLTAIIIVVAAVVVHRKFGLMSWHNPFVIFWWYSTLFLGSGLLYASIYSWYIDIAPTTFYLIWAGMGSALAGALISRASFGPGLGRNLWNGGIVSVETAEIRRGLALLLISAGIGAAVMYYAMAGAVPFLAPDADNFRIEARMGRGWIVLLSLGLLRYGIIQYAAASGNLQSKLLKVMAVILVAAMFAIGMGDRAPGLEICFFGLLTFLLFSGRMLSTKRMAILGVIGLAAMAILGIIRQGLEIDWLMVGLQMIWRPFVNIQNLQWICDYFPSNHDFLFGQGYWIDFVVLLPGYSPNFGTWFKEQSGLVFSGGSVTVSYLGEIFANFGWWGVPIIAGCYGFVMSALSSLLSRGMKGDRLIILILLAISLKGIVSSGLISVLLYDTLPLLVVHFLFQWTVRAVSQLSNPAPHMAAGRA